MTIASLLVGPAALADSPTPGVGIFSQPNGVAFSPDGKRAYVLDMLGDFQVFNAATNKRIAEVNTWGENQSDNGFDEGIAVSPDSRSVFLALDNSARVELVQFSASSLKVTRRFPLHGKLGATAISQDGLTAYVRGSDSGVAYLHEITLLTGLVRSIALGSTVEGLPSSTAVVISDDNSTAYVTAGTRTRAVAKVDTATARVSRLISVQGIATGLAMSSDGKTVYVAASTVQGIDTARNIVRTIAAVPSDVPLASLAVSPDGTKLVVPASSGSHTNLWVLSPSTGAVISVTYEKGSAGHNGAGCLQHVAISRDSMRAYVADWCNGLFVVSFQPARPRFTSDNVAISAVVGSSYEAQFSASGFPAPRYSNTGALPPGVLLNALTGDLVGAPTLPGKFSFRVVLSNGSGPDAIGVTHTITVLGRLTSSTPSITGNPRVGMILTAVTRPWGPVPVRMSYQWYRLVRGQPVNITQATDDSYRIVAADRGTSIGVVLTGKKAGYLDSHTSSKQGIDIR